MAGPWEQYQSAPAAAADGPWAAYQKTEPQDFSFKPDRDMSMAGRALAGAGKAVADTGRGVGQWLGLTSRDDVAEARRLDAPLMDTTAGKVGNFAGNAALLAPASLIPGAATIPGAAIVGGVAGLAQPSTSTGETLLNAGLGVAGGAGGQAIGNKVGALIANRAQTKIAQQTAAQAADAQRIAAAQRGMDAGYVIPPADLNPGAITEALSGLSGKIKTAQTASQRNQTVTDGLAKKSLGIAEDQPLTIAALDGIRAKAGQAYQAVENVGTITPGKTYNDALDNIVAPHLKAIQGFPNAKPSPVIAEIESLRSPQFDAGSAVEKIKALRSGADEAYAQGNKTLGKALKDGAGALEGAIDDHLVTIGAPKDLLQNFRDARQTIAKTYTVQKALNDQTGNVSAQSLAKDLAKVRPLIGDLATIAKMGQAFPKATQSLKEAPKQLSPLDFAVAAATGAGTMNPASAAMLAARPLARQGLLSPAYQRAAIKQSAPSAGMMGLLDQDIIQGLSAPVGVTGGLLFADR
jgi:hypothetical protein